MKILSSILYGLYIVSLPVWYILLLFRVAFLDYFPPTTTLIETIFYGSLWCAFLVPIIAFITLTQVYRNKDYAKTSLFVVLFFLLYPLLVLINGNLVESMQKKYELGIRQDLIEEYSAAPRDFISIDSPENFLSIESNNVFYRSKNLLTGDTAKIKFGVLNSENHFSMDYSDEIQEEDLGTYYWNKYTISPLIAFNKIINFTNKDGKKFSDMYLLDSWTVYLGSGWFKNDPNLHGGYEGDISLSIYANYFNSGKNLNLKMNGNYLFYDVFYPNSNESKMISLEFIKDEKTSLYKPVKPLTESEVYYLSRISSTYDLNHNQIPFSLSDIIVYK